MAKATAKNRIAVVGGGISGLMATLKICEAGGEVDLFSYCPPKRSHCLCAQGGMNACMDTKGEGDTTYIHFDDTVYGGDFLADQVAVKGMCEAAPGIVEMFDRMGVPFTRTAEGVLDLRNFGGQKKKRTVFAGSTTGQQLLYALDEQVRKWETKGQVHTYIFWEFIKIIKNKQGVCRGMVAQNMNSMEIKAFREDAVILATGGPGQIFGLCTASTICNGSAVGAVYAQGAHIGNPEFIQIHPTAIPGTDKNRLMSEACRGEGGRIWVYKNGQPWYFLEEKYPDYGNLVPRDIASREIFDVCVNQGLGVDGENKVYLDLSHIPADYLERKLGGILEMYSEFMGQDPRKVPMTIYPSVHYSMGGIWVDREHNTNIPGLMASGECDYQYHGANRLGANSLLSAAYSGTIVGPVAMKWATRCNKLREMEGWLARKSKGESLMAAQEKAIAQPSDSDLRLYEESLKEARSIHMVMQPKIESDGTEKPPVIDQNNLYALRMEMGDELTDEELEAARQECVNEFENILQMNGEENAHELHQELGRLMNKYVTIERVNKDLDFCFGEVKKILARWNNIGVTDRGHWANQEAMFVRQLRNMILYALVITKAARMRDESRGAHFKREFPNRDDEHFMKITVADYDPKTEEPVITYEDFDHSLIKPRARTYGSK